MPVFTYNCLLGVIQYCLLRQTVEVRGQSVCMSKTDFQSLCNSKQGYAYGAQCFFIANQLSTWENGWRLCEQENAIMAHLHNSKIYSFSIKEGQRTGYDAVFANRRYYTPDKVPRDITQYFWHTSKTNWWTNFTWANTWSRSYTDNDDNKQGEVMTAFFRVDYVGDGIETFADFYAMCEIWNLQQTFATTQPGMCIDEQAILDFSAASEQDCCDMCVQYMWCYSFNFIIAPSKKCQLFSWDLTDNPKLRNDANCFIYQNSD